MAEKVGSKFIERGSHKGKGIAVLTSGGDSQVNSELLIFAVLPVVPNSLHRE